MILSKEMNVVNPNVLINSDYGPMIININDSVIGRHISQFGYWAKDDIALIKQLLDFLLGKKDSIVFYDVGANIGTHSLAVSKSYGGKVKVRAFEAQRQIFNMLCGMVALNGLSNVHCHNVAVGDGDVHEIEIPLPDYGRANNFGALELIPPLKSDNHDMIKNNYENINVVTLDDFDESVDFIKIDVEGMENKVLAGARCILKKHRPIFFIEVHKTDLGYVVDVLKEEGYLGFKKNIDLIAIPGEYGIQVSGLDRIF